VDQVECADGIGKRRAHPEAGPGWARPGQAWSVSPGAGFGRLPTRGQKFRKSTPLDVTERRKNAFIVSHER